MSPPSRRTNTSSNSRAKGNHRDRVGAPAPAASLDLKCDMVPSTLVRRWKTPRAWSDNDRIADYMFCLLHRSQYEVVDDWRTLGMRATSSKTVRCSDVFVPAHRALSMYVAREGHSFPGLAVHRNPMYRIPIAALGGHGIGGCLVGNARAALETAIAMVKSRRSTRRRERIPGSGLRARQKRPAAQLRQKFARIGIIAHGSP